MINIEINNSTNFKINQKEIKNFCHRVLKKIRKQVDLSIAFVSPKEIKKLNQVYRHINRPTDVLSFEETNEIIICPQQAKKQAKEVGHSLKEELQLLLVHGFLHLFGYDHQTIRQKRQMDTLTKKLLK